MENANGKMGFVGKLFNKPRPNPFTQFNQSVNLGMGLTDSNNAADEIDGGICYRWVDGRRVRGKMINGTCVLGAYGDASSAV